MGTPSNADDGLGASEHAAPVGVDSAMVALSLSLTVVCTLPVWLTAAMAVQMRAELGFSIVALGGAVAVFRLAGAAAAAPAGRIIDRLGPGPALRSAAVMAIVSSLGVAVLTHRWATLVACLAVAGVANALGQTAANLALVRTVAPRRQGIAFGIKQSALPVGSLLAGLAVPLIALTFGWRWAFVLSAVLAAVIAVSVPSTQAKRYAASPAAPERPYGRIPLVALGLGFFFAMAAANMLTTYIVESSVAASMSESSAGLVLTLGSLFAIGTRLYVGWQADRRHANHLRTTAVMVLSGSIGYALIAFGNPTLILVGAALAFSCGWGFNGLFWYGIIRFNQDRPARATGVLMPGGMLGGVIGPVAFGAIVDAVSYQAAWSTAAAAGLLGSICMLIGQRMLTKEFVRL